MKRGMLPLVISVCIGAVYLVSYFSGFRFVYTGTEAKIFGFEYWIPDLPVASYIAMVIIGLFFNLCAIIVNMPSLAIGAAVFYGVAIGLSPTSYPFTIIEMLLCLFAAIRMRDTNSGSYITRDEFITTLEFYRNIDQKNRVVYQSEESAADKPHVENDSIGNSSFVKPNVTPQASYSQNGNSAKYIILLLVVVLFIGGALAVPRILNKQGIITTPSNDGSQQHQNSDTDRNNEKQLQTSSIPDLKGYWKMDDEGDTIMGGEISGNEITLYWLMEDGTQALYWSGTYIQPTTPDLPYIWTSVNDKSKTENAIMASGDDTKVFTYANDTISYSASAMGVTKTIKLHRSNDLSFG